MSSRMPTEERQASIVAAALRLACDASPAFITTGDIAAAVGVTQGALFKHFPTKEAIWVAAMGWVRETLLQAIDAAAVAAPDAVAALEGVFHAHVDFVVTHPGVPRVIFHELQQPADSPTKQEVRALLQGYRKRLLSLLAQAVQGGLLRADLDQEAAATLFVGIIQGLVMQSMLSGGPASMRSQADRAFDLYLQGVRGAR